MTYASPWAECRTMISSKHLLLIDDEEDFLALTRLLLEMEGFRVSTASSGEEAVALVDGGSHPDLVVLDQRMPGLTGVQTLARLKDVGLAVPALLLSAVDDIDHVCADGGFDAALSKPFTIDDLLERVQKLLHQA